MATWTNEQKLSGQTAITYNAAVTYNSSIHNYNGREQTQWTEETKN